MDDQTHQVVGCDEDDRLQVIYHFTVGGAVDDARLQILPAYHHLETDS